MAEIASAGYTLPVWVAAAARAAVGQLLGEAFEPEPLLRLAWAADEGGIPEENGTTAARDSVAVPVVAAAPLAEGRALAVARCESGAALDLTRGLVVWVEAGWASQAELAAQEGSWLILEAGEGVGVHGDTGRLCLSDYARRLLEENLRPLLPPGRALRLRLIFPSGRRLAERTSNAAFGVVDGLALIGTSAQVQHSAAPDQLAQARGELARRVALPDFSGDLVLVIGENGLDLALRLGLPETLLLKAGNWLGPLLVAAAEAGVTRLLLFGYQGKLIKLAGGIFHTHHHLADGRAEVLTALAALAGLPAAWLERLYSAATVDAALAELAVAEPLAAADLRDRIAAAVEQRSRAYLGRYDQTGTAVGAVLFDRSRAIVATGPVGRGLWGDFGGRPLG